MPTGTDVVRAASAILSTRGIHYGSTDCPHRCDPEISPHCVDCSGLTSATMRRIGLGWGCTGSFEQSRLFHQQHRGLSYSVAVRTPGAFGFQGINEGQGGIPGRDPGHVVIFVGDGVHTLEARGHASGVGMFLASSLYYDYCGMPPGVSAERPDTIPPQTHITLPPTAAGTQEDDLMTTIALPPGPTTIHGRNATARALRGYNVIYLENGARLAGDTPVAGDPTRHTWAPPKAEQIPGWTILDVADLRPVGKTAVSALYTAPDGSVVTYEAPLVR